MGRCVRMPLGEWKAELKRTAIHVGQLTTTPQPSFNSASSSPCLALAQGPQACSHQHPRGEITFHSLKYQTAHPWPGFLVKS